MPNCQGPDAAYLYACSQSMTLTFSPSPVDSTICNAAVVSNTPGCTPSAGVGIVTAAYGGACLRCRGSAPPPACQRSSACVCVRADGAAAAPCVHACVGACMRLQKQPRA